jgi:histidinol-phosphate phosphatase family protein
MNLSYDLCVFDADGTIRETTIPGQWYPKAPDEWRLRDGVKERLAAIDWNKVGFGVASNQGGVFKGELSEAMARKLLVDMVREAMPEWAVGEAAFRPHMSTGFLQLCPHDTRGVCSCRKPMPGMLTRIMAWYDVNPCRTLFVGNADTDRKAAENAGCMYLDEADFFAGREP